MGDHLRVVLDGTPLLGRRTGVGRYVQGLVSGFQQAAGLERAVAPEQAAALPQVDGLDVVLTAFSWRGERPDGTWVGRRVPARLLQECWSRSALPPVEWLTGRADVFHATNFVLPPTRRAAGVVTVHDLAFLRHADTVTADVLRYRELVPRGLRRARAVITPSEAVRQQVVEHLHVDPEKVHAVPHGVDPAWSATAAPTPEWLGEHGLPERYRLFVGTLEPRKDLPTLLAATRLLRARGDDTPLVLAGPAGWGEGLDLTGLADVVTRTGWLEDDVLRRVVAGADTLVLPSRDEGFGLTVLEALACGTAVVASDLPVLVEVGGQHVAYAPVGDPEAFAAVLQQPPASTPDDRSAHAAQFTWPAAARATAAVYRAASR